jgi:flagellar hook assembly protein FlgD
MQFKSIIVIIVLLLVVAVSASGCIGGGNDVGVTPTATPTTVPTVKATVKATVTVKPTPKPTTDYSKSIEQHWTNEGDYVIVPFTKTTVDGKEAYKGSVSDGRYTYKVTAVLTSTTSEASSYGNSLISKYMAQGYITEKSSSDSDNVVLAKGTSFVGIGMYDVVYGTNSPGVAILEY